MTIVTKNSLTLSNVNDGTDAPTIFVKSYTFSADSKAYIEVTGPNAFKQTVGNRGHNVWVLDIATHKLKEFVSCDTYTAMSFIYNGISMTFADYLASLTDSIVIIAASDADRIDQDTRNVLDNMGGSPELGTWGSYRAGHVFIGMSKRSDGTWPLQPRQGYEEAIQKDGSSPEIGCTLSNGGIVVNGATGPKGDRGDDGIAGKDGVGLKSTTITYGISSSDSTMPDTWSQNPPALVKGQWFWTKTQWTYTDNSTETGYQKTYIAKDGNNGNDGIAGKDGTGIKTTDITYVGSTSGTASPSSGWTSSIPTVPSGQFLWTKTVWTYTDNTSETGYSVAKMGDTGPKGDRGTDGIAGKDGNGIKTTDITYAISTSGTTAPTSGWTTSVPSLVKGQYLWTKTIWTYTDNSSKTGYSVTYISKDGNNGTDGIAGKDGNGIKTTTITYVGSISGTTVPISGWTSTIPNVAAGSYLWTKTVWTYTDNTSETGYSVAKMGNTGPTGPAGAPGTNGAPGKVVSDTEPISLFKGLTWKYSGTANLTASDGTVINPNTEYYYNGSHWVINYFSVNNFASESITSDKIDGKNLTITNGEFISNTTNGPVATSTEIKDNHIAISKTDGTVNTRNDIALDSEQGLAQKFTNINTGFYRTAGINYQGPFTSDSDGNYAQLTPQGTKLSTDVPWTTLSTTNGFSGGLFQFSVQNRVEFFSISGLGVPQMNANQWYQATSLPVGSSAIPSVNRVYAISGNNNAWDLLINPAGGIFIRCQAAVSATSNLVNGGCGFPIG